MGVVSKRSLHLILTHQVNHLWPFILIKKKTGRYCESCVPLHLKISNLKFDHFKQLDAVYYVDMALSINTDYHQCHFFQFKKQTFLPSSVECSRQICGSFRRAHPKLKKICIIKTQKKKIK